MKRLYFFSFFIFIGCFSLFAQDCSDGSAPLTQTVDFTGRTSFDEIGDLDNEFGFFSFGVAGDIVGVVVENLNLSTVGASWCSEASIDLGGEIFLAPSLQGSVGPCADLPFSLSADLAELGLVFPTDVAGDVSWEIYEDFDDNPGAADAQFTGGTMTLFHCPTGSVLPVELVNFRGERKENAHLLSWDTERETNNEGFMIERSVDGRQWNEIGWVSGNGNSDVTRSYRHEDKSLLTGTTYFYRLKQMDHDGSFHYSEVIELGAKTTGGVVIGEVYPNPLTSLATGRIQVTADKATTTQISLVDILGREVVQQRVELTEGINTLELPAFPELANGLYLLTIQVGEKSILRKINVKN